MTDKNKNEKSECKANLELAFDVGHSSIGWSVLKIGPNLEVIGCGAVIFRADDCLASARRGYRRQRRHIRSTRQRIKRIKKLLLQLGVLPEKELDATGHSAPWKLAARVLSSKSRANPSMLLTWRELWDVLRWYAHNRGYDGNKRWSAASTELDQEEDTEKVQNACGLMEKHGTRTMAETFCASLGLDPLGEKSASQVRFKAFNAAFPRETVEAEVREILHRHRSHLQGVDEKFEKTLMEDWKALPCESIKLASRYKGGLLFGQLVPRFDNRIISKCPLSGQKVPSRDCSEFFNFRWGMILANMQVADSTETDLRPLTMDERRAIDRVMRTNGSLTVNELKSAVNEVTGCQRSNLETMFMHPDSKKALMLDQAQALETSDKLKPY